MSSIATNPSLTQNADDLRRLSFWWDTLGEDLDAQARGRAPLPGSTTADVVIVGAGYTGLWTAYYLAAADPSLRIVVLEREVAGFGASGRNGGWCSALFPASIDKVARSSTRSGAIALTKAMNATVDEVGKVVAAEGIDCHWQHSGTIVAARTEVQMDRARAEVAEWASWGFGPDDHRLLDGAEARGILNATDVIGGVYTPHCATIHPARLVRGLAAAVERRGVTIHEHTPVTSLEPGIVRTPFGDIRAPHVVRATEGYTPGLPGHERDVVPVYSLMLATEPLPQSFWDTVGLQRRETFGDFRHLIIYGQRTADDRFAFGGRGAPYHYGSAIRPEFDRDQRVYDELWRVLVELFPTIDGHLVTHRWGGPLGVPRDWYASVGLDKKTGIAWGGGYVGDGVGTSNLAGRTLADLLLHRDTDLTALPWVNHRSPRWEYEPLRFLGTNIGLRAMTAADGEEFRTGAPSRLAGVFGRFLGH